jgi:hypothetical protein
MEHSKPIEIHQLNECCRVPELERELESWRVGRKFNTSREFKRVGELESWRVGESSILQESSRELERRELTGAKCAQLLSCFCSSLWDIFFSFSHTPTTTTTISFSPSHTT